MKTNTQSAWRIGHGAERGKGHSAWSIGHGSGIKFFSALCAMRHALCSLRPALCALPLALCAPGCASQGVDMAKVAEQFYTQQRNYDVLTISGVSELNIKGSNISMIVSAEMAPLSIMPANPSTAQAVLTTIKDTALMGLGIYTGGQVMRDLAKRPATVSPEIVRPEVIQVPQ